MLDAFPASLAKTDRCLNFLSNTTYSLNCSSSYCLPRVVFLIQDFSTVLKSFMYIYIYNCMDFVICGCALCVVAPQPSRDRVEVGKGD